MKTLGSSLRVLAVSAGAILGLARVGQAFTIIDFVDLQATKTSTGPAIPGAGFGYQVTIRHALGLITVPGAIVSDTLPPTLEGATWSCSATPLSSCTPSGTGDINDTVTLAPGGTLTYTISGTLARFPTFGTIINTATVTSPGTIGDIIPGNNSATATDPLVPDAALTITHDDSPDPVVTNGTVTYVTRITNNGPSPTVELNLDVTVPAGATFVTVDNPGCFFDPPANVRCPSPSLGDLSPGDSVVVTIGIQAPSTSGTISSIATAGSNSSSPVSATASTRVLDPADTFIQIFTVSSIDSQNTLEWRTPLLGYDHTKIRYRDDGTCPSAPTIALGDSQSTDLLVAVEPGPGGKGFLQHGVSNGTTYCYGIWVAHDFAETLFSVAKFAKGRPFDTSGPAKWAFSTGATAVSPPGIGGPGVYVPSNDRGLYGVGRGDTPPAGQWIPGFTPALFSLPVQSRPPVVPVTILGQNPIVFVTSQDGGVSALGASQGDPDPNNSPPDALWNSPLGATAQAAAAAWLQAFGGDANWVFPSTRAASNNSVFALDASSGSIVGPAGAFGSLIMGPVNGGVAVDYANKRVYFTSRVGGDGKSVRCLPLVTTAGSEGFGAPCWEATGLGDIDYGPILRNGKVFVARNTGAVSALDGNTGLPDWTFSGIGLPNGFPFLDRTNEDLYITAGGRVRGLTHLSPTARWTVASIPNPSQPLFSTIGGIGYVFVGSSDGNLYQIDALTGTVINSVLLGGGGSVIGAPSLDVPNSLIYVGSDAGVVYAVRVPLP